jgi:hypothetical protein
MSIFASSFSIDGDVEDEDGKAPIIYEASHARRRDRRCPHPGSH